MDMSEAMLCAANSYDRKYYLDPAFGKLPRAVKEELQIACVLFCEKTGGMLQLCFDEEGNLNLRTSCLENDFSYDDINAGLMVRELRKEKEELFRSLELYYKLAVKKKRKLKGFSIGGVKLKNRYVLAPMAGVSGLPFRLLCHEMGAGLVCMEMVSAKAIHYHNKKTAELMKISPLEKPVSLQLFGRDPEIMAEAAAAIEELPFDILDINAGCPMPKIVNNGEGSALMKEPLLLGKIVGAVAGAVKKPVTVKLRSGFDAAHINAPLAARIAEENGAAAIHIHGRTREQYYEGRADWDVIRRVKEAVSVPVIGNGDVTGAEDAEKLLKETGCDAVSVGRAARGNPWIFKGLCEGRDYEPEPEERLQMIRRQLLLEVEEKGEFTAVREMRKHIGWYSAGLPNSSRLRSAVCGACTLPELQGLLRDFEAGMGLS